jgi:hypothetical protein
MGARHEPCEKTVGKKDRDKLWSTIFVIKPIILVKAFNLFSVQCLNIAYHKLQETLSIRKEAVFSARKARKLYSQLFSSANETPLTSRIFKSKQILMKKIST